MQSKSRNSRRLKRRVWTDGCWTVRSSRSQHTHTHTQSFLRHPHQENQEHTVVIKTQNNGQKDSEYNRECCLMTVWLKWDKTEKQKIVTTRLLQVTKDNQKAAHGHQPRTQTTWWGLNSGHPLSFVSSQVSLAKVLGHTHLVACEY